MAGPKGELAPRGSVASVPRNPAHTRADSSRVGIWGDAPGKQSASSSFLPVLTGRAPGSVPGRGEPWPESGEQHKCLRRPLSSLSTRVPAFRRLHPLSGVASAARGPHLTRAEKGPRSVCRPADVGVRSQHPQTQPPAAGEAESRTQGQFESNPGASLPLSQHGGRRWARPASGVPFAPRPSPPLSQQRPCPSPHAETRPLSAGSRNAAPGSGVLPGVKPARCPILCRGSL